MVVIQEVAAEIGSVTGRGIAHNLRRHYSPWLLRGVVALLLIANIINLGADLGAMGAALDLLIGGPEQLYTLLFGVVCIVLEVWLSYPRYAAILKWTTLSLFSYVAVVFVADVPWGTGAALSLVGLDPVRALYWAAVVNGVLAAPLMAVMMLIVRNPRVMGRLTLSRSMAIWAGAQLP